MQNLKIRNFKTEDIEKIKEINGYFSLLYRAHKDFIKENIFCLVEEEEILGVAHIEYENSFHQIDKIKDPKYVFKIKAEMALKENANEESKEMLLDAIIKRANEIKDNYPNKNIKLIHFFMNEEINEMNFYLKKGFLPHKNILILERDLTENLPQVNQRNDFEIVIRKFKNDLEKQEYLDLEAKCNDGACMSINNLNWTTYAPNWELISVYQNKKLIGSLTTWKFTDDHYATEYIFIDPSYQGMGIGGQLITHVLSYLNSKNVKKVTLTVYSSNIKAIKLYLKLGYKLQGYIFEYAI